MMFSVSFFRSLRRLIRAVAEVARNPETAALPVIAGVLILTGTIFYWRAEGWTIVQAFYFSVITLTTVGYGDLTPKSAGTQIFTVVYLLVGVGVFVALLTSLAQAYIKQQSEPRKRLRGHRQHSGPE
jgi:voltage-gated potassium channel